ncbi:MAG: hypothetical protein ACHQEM_00130 [Chitinophagales bacterium]
MNVSAYKNLDELNNRLTTGNATRFAIYLLKKIVSPFVLWIPKIIFVQ